MRRTLCLFSLVALIGNSVQAQTELKLYQNADFFTVTKYDRQMQAFTSSGRATFNRISLAVAWHVKKNRFHELEFFIPKINDPSDVAGIPVNYQLDETSTGMTRKTNAYSLRYGFSKEVKQMKNMIFSLGGGINPFYIKTDYISSIPTTYNRYLWTYGASLNVIPRIKFAVWQKFSFEFSLPIKVFDVMHEQQKIENPSIPIAQQESGRWESKFFEDAFNLRLGLAYKL